MIDGYSIIPVIQVEYTTKVVHLIHLLKQYRPIIDEIHLFTQTTDVLVKTPYKFVREYFGTWSPSNTYIESESPVLYIQFDEKIEKVDTLENFIKYCTFCLTHPQYSRVYGNTLQDKVCQGIHTRFGGQVRFEHAYDIYKGEETPVGTMACVGQSTGGSTLFGNYVCRIAISEPPINITNNVVKAVAKSSWTKRGGKWVVSK
jgi:hypothetical protein